MEPGKKGTKVRVVEAEPFNDYRVGQELIVEVVDESDNTFRGRDMTTGNMGGWINWSQVEEVGGAVSWDFLQRVLTPQTVQLLQAFDGLHRLRLRSEVADTILLELPDLEARIRDAVHEQKPGRARMKRRDKRRSEDRPGPRSWEARDSVASTRPVAETESDEDEPETDTPEDSHEEGEGGWLEGPLAELESLLQADDLSNRIAAARRTQKEG